MCHTLEYLVLIKWIDGKNLKDIFSKINVPFIVQDDIKNKEHDLVLKTVIRKSNFRSLDPEIEI